MSESTQKEKVLNSRLQLLNAAIAELSAELVTLRTRLEPLMVSAPPDDASPKVAEPPLESALIRELREDIMNIQQASSVIREILARLEV